MNLVRTATLMTTAAIALTLAQPLTAAEIELPLPPPLLTPQDQPLVGRVVVLELGDGETPRQLIPEADVQLWKGQDGSLGKRPGMALRDNGWSVALIRWSDEELTAANSARLLLPMGGVEREGSARFSIHRMLVPWTEGAGWSHSGHATWSGPRGGHDYEPEPVATLELADPEGGKRQVVLESAALSALIAGWADRSIPNHGVVLRFDGKALQTSVPGREALTESNVAILGQGGTLAFAWRDGLFERLLTRPDDLRDVVLEVELRVEADAVGGVLEATQGDTVIARAPITAAGTQRVTLAGLAPAAHRAGGTLRWSGPGSVSVILKGDTRPNARATIIDHASTDFFPRELPFRDGVFVRAEDGRLTYGGERLRLWGTLGYGSKARIRATGFNAYRLWGPNTQRNTTPAQSAEYGKRGELPPTTKGDDSGLDLFDREYAECRELGLWVMATFLMRDWIPGADQPGSFVDDGGDFAAWSAAINEKDWNPAKLAKFVGMVDERFALIRERAASQILNRVNPYTGIRYAEDEIIAIHELANEKQVVKELLEGKLRTLPAYFQRAFDRAWMDFLRRRYADHGALTTAWGELRAGESLAENIALAPLQSERNDYPDARAADVIRFVCEAHMGYLDRMRTHARSHAPEGVGVAVIPFSYDTQYRPHNPWAYSNSGGDVQNFGMYFWNYGSDLTKPPSMYVMDQTTVAGKPTVIYETNRGRPSPYRSEYPFMLAAFAAWQDWDAIFFHYWGGPKDPTTDEAYLLRTMSNGNHDHFWTAVHAAEDPVMCAAIATAGQAFLGGHLPAAPNPVTVRVGAEGIFSYKNMHGIGQAAAAFQRGSRLRFEPDAAFAVEWPDDAPQAMPEDRIEAGPITWDWANARLIVDTPTAKFLVGRTAAHTFADGIACSGFDVPWAALAVVSADGKPLASGCEQAWVSATAHAQNTGFDIDLSAKLGGPINQIKARRENGHAPVVVDRVGFTLGFPSAITGELVVHDFAHRERMRVPFDADGALRLRDQELYVGLLRIDSRGKSRVAAVDPLRVVVDAAEQAKRQLPSRSGLWFPIAGLNWDTTALQALARLGDKARLDGEHVLISDGRLLLDAPAIVRLNYSWERMNEVSAEFPAAPGWDEAVAALTAQFGQPHAQQRGTQFEGSRAAWQVARDGGTFQLELTDIQGVMRLSLTPPGSDR